MKRRANIYYKDDGEPRDVWGADIQADADGDYFTIGYYDTQDEAQVAVRQWWEKNPQPTEKKSDVSSTQSKQASVKGITPPQASG